MERPGRRLGLFSLIILSTPLSVILMSLRRRISESQCTVTPTFADSSGLDHFLKVLLFLHLSLRMTRWLVIFSLSVILMNEVKKNLRTTMHNHSDLRRFFGTQPFLKCKTFCAFVPQNDTLVSYFLLIFNSDERSEEESPYHNVIVVRE